jgi:hypothetical protein
MHYYREHAKSKPGKKSFKSLNSIDAKRECSVEEQGSQNRGCQYQGRQHMIEIAFWRESHACHINRPRIKSDFFAEKARSLKKRRPPNRSKIALDQLLNSGILMNWEPEPGFGFRRKERVCAVGVSASYSSGETACLAREVFKFN